MEWDLNHTKNEYVYILKCRNIKYPLYVDKVPDSYEWGVYLLAAPTRSGRVRAGKPQKHVWNSLVFRHRGKFDDKRTLHYSNGCTYVIIHISHRKIVA